MKLKRVSMRILIGLLGAAILILPTVTRAQSVGPDIHPAEENCWSSFLPVWAEEA
jgi:hypothetical protein